MAAYDNSSFIGDKPVALSADELERIENFDPYLGQRARALSKPASFECVPVVLNAQVPSGGSAFAAYVKAPYPFKILRIDATDEVRGGSASALTLQVEAKPSGGSFASILDGGTAVDVFNTVKEVTEITTADGSEDIAADTELKFTWAATGDTVDGAQAKIWIQRL